METFGRNNDQARLSQTRILSALAVLHPHPTLPDRLVAVATSKLHIDSFDLVRHATLTIRTRAAVLRPEVAHAHAVVVAEVQWRLLAARVSAAPSRLQRNDPSSVDPEHCPSLARSTVEAIVQPVAEYRWMSEMRNCAFMWGG